MHREAKRPNHTCPQGLEHDTVHRRQGSGHGYAGHVVSGAREGVDNDHVDQWWTVLQHGKRVDLILEVPPIVARHEVEYGEGDDQHDQHAPEALKADDLIPRQIHVSQQPLFRNDLGGLHHLAGQGQSDAQEQQPVARSAAGSLGRLVAPDAGEAHGDDTHDAEGQAQPMVTKELPLQASHSKYGREYHFCPAQQLPYACRDVQKAHATEASGHDVKDGWHAHHQDLA
mmetsp:Transcript_17063/g.23078  ORF Transcript_17063/g.23078 Transcript_17063/m.23078 type:complete len:228 (+) Transcript_17063:391-1074(+)